MTKNEAIKLIENMHDVFPSRQEEILDIFDQLDLRTEKDLLKIELAEYIIALYEVDMGCNLKRLHTNKEIEFIKQIQEIDK